MSFVLFKVGPLILGICILAMLLIPTSTGPFSAVHGPATTFVAIRAASRILFAMATYLKCASAFRVVALSGFIIVFESMSRFTLGEEPAPVSSVLRI